MEIIPDENGGRSTISHATEYGNIDLGVTFVSDIIKNKETNQQQLIEKFNPQVQFFLNRISHL